MKSIIRIAQIRVVPEKGKLDVNHEKLISVLEELEAGNVDVVVTPECFLDGYVATEQWVTAENINEYAVDPYDNSMVRSISKWARQNAAWVILGCSRLSPEGTYNTALILDREGKLRGTYDKTHCQTHDKKYLPGERLAVLDSDFGLFGVMICADRRWPETVRSLAIKGARVIFNPTFGMHDENNMHMMQTRSYESEIFIAFTHPLQSLLTGPTGEIISDETDDGMSFALSEIDLSEVNRVRSGDSAHLKDRRSDIYGS